MGIPRMTLRELESRRQPWKGWMLTDYITGPYFWKRTAGIEPASPAWKAGAQPLYHARVFSVVHTVYTSSHSCQAPNQISQRKVRDSNSRKTKGLLLISSQTPLTTQATFHKLYPLLVRWKNYIMNFCLFVNFLHDVILHFLQRGKF